MSENKPTKPKRQMTSFELDDDNARILSRVEREGRIKTRFINDAIRMLGRERGYARKKDLQAA